MPRPFQMLYIFSYDIPSTKPGDRRRARLAKFLESIGLRVQGSVFEVPLNPEKLESIIELIRPILKESEDSLRVYPLCAACTGRLMRIGVDAPIEHSEKIMVW